MTGDRSDEQVLSSAAQMDAALAGGLSVEQLASLVEARRTWQNTGRIDRSPELLDAVGHPAAPTWDEVFVAAVRRHQKPSDQRRNVTP